jgi:hypothetical protein
LKRAVQQFLVISLQSHLHIHSKPVKKQISKENEKGNAQIVNYETYGHPVVKPGPTRYID